MTTRDLIDSGLPIDVRAGDPEQDAIDGVVPALVVEPHTAEAVAASLAWASEQRLSVVIRGAGTKHEWGRRPERMDVILSTRRLNRLIAHQHGDLTATVEAGLTLREMNHALASRGQQLPLDPLFADRATIGGLLATNDSGSLRHRYGTPRDLVIGVQLATTDGRLTKAGGQVVKNVAGYDLSKLVSGSFGSLAAIVSATFKLSPLPPASATVVVELLDAAKLHEAVTAIASTQIEPSAVEVHARRGTDGSGGLTRMLLRFASLAAAVDAQAAEACARLTTLGLAANILQGSAEQSLWHQHSTIFHAATGALVRASWLPADLVAVLRTLEELARGGPAEMIGRAGIGAGLIRIDGDTPRQTAAIERLRESAKIGNVVVMRGSPDLKAKVDVWGPRQSASLVDAVKRAMDPQGILGAGRGAA